MYLYLRIFSQLFNILKINLNIWHKVLFVRYVKFIITYWGWYFKFIVFIPLFGVFSCIVDTDNAIYLSLLFQSFLSEQLSTNLCESENLIFPEFMNVVPILYYIYIELSILSFFFLWSILISFLIWYLLLIVMVLLVFFEAFSKC